MRLRRLPPLLLVGLLLTATGSQAGPAPQLVDPAGDTAVSALPTSASYDLLGVRLDGQRRGRALSGLVIRVDTAGVPAPNVATAYRVELYVGGCTLIVSAYDNRGQALRDCDNTGHDVVVSTAARTLTMQVPLAALGKGVRVGSLANGIEARVVLTEGHDRYDATVLDEGSTDAVVRL